jgi:hypothetical protein
MSQSSGPVIGYPWYSAQDYDAIRALMVDGDTMPATFAEWARVRIEMGLNTIANGCRVIRVPLQSMAFAQWCEGRSMIPDANARYAYAARHADSGSSAVVRSRRCSIPDGPEPLYRLTYF